MSANGSIKALVLSVIAGLLLTAGAPALAQEDGEMPIAARLDCLILNDRIRLLEMMREGRSAVAIDLELEKHKDRVFDLVAGTDRSLVAVAEKSLYRSEEIVHRARHGNPFVIHQEIEIALYMLVSAASGRPACDFAEDVAALIDRLEGE